MLLAERSLAYMNAKFVLESYIAEVEKLSRRFIIYVLQLKEEANAANPL